MIQGYPHFRKPPKIKVPGMTISLDSSPQLARTRVLQAEQDVKVLVNQAACALWDDSCACFLSENGGILPIYGHFKRETEIQLMECPMFRQAPFCSSSILLPVVYVSVFADCSHLKLPIILGEFEPWTVTRFRHLKVVI